MKTYFVCVLSLLSLLAGTTVNADVDYTSWDLNSGVSCNFKEKDHFFSSKVVCEKTCWNKNGNVIFHRLWTNDYGICQF